MGECWVERFDTEPCDGPLIRAHLLPQQLLRQRFPEGAVLIDGSWRSYKAWRRGRVRASGVLLTTDYRPLREILDDERIWMPCCGGCSGLEGHHGRLDGFRVEIPRGELPGALEEAADELELGWWLDKRWPR